jgi:adenine deaminase
VRAFVRFAFVVAAATLMIRSAIAAPTPVPGGANQAKAVAGKLGATLFNSTIRLKLLELRAATDAESTTVAPAADKKVMVMSVLVRNGLSENFAELLRYTLADKDEVTVVIPDIDVKPNPLNIQQAASAKQRATFVVDKTFSPTKLIVACATCNAARHFRAFRIALPATSAQ